MEILTVPNPDGLSSLSADASFADAGDYIIEVSGENGGTGQFVLSLQPGAALPEPVELTANTPVADTVGSQTPVRLYRFASTPDDALTLTVVSESPDVGVLISLFDEDASKTIASSDATLGGVAYRLPRQERHFRLDIRAGGADDIAFTICLGNCDSGLPARGTNSQPSVEVVQTPEIVPTSCTVASATGGSINIRSGPGTQYAVIGNLAAGGSLPVLGQLAGGGWYQVSINGQTGWAAASVTRLDGECDSLPMVAAPAGAQLAPTQAPTTQPSSGGSAPTTAAPQGPLPDLFVTFTSASIVSTGKPEILFVIDNRGTATSGSFSFNMCANDTCFTEMVTPVNPGSPKFFDRVLEYPVGAGVNSVNVSVTVDTGNQVVESDESNNVATETAERLLPDLTASITSFTIDANGFAHVDYTMSNIGAAPTNSPFILTLCVDLTCSTYNIVEPMEPGFSSGGTTIRNEWEADPLAAFPRATVTIDSGGAITESNESNNVASAFPT
ncbi:MAG: CARDB domain-containing protein [Anaerolineae bacterium]